MKTNKRFGVYIKNSKARFEITTSPEREPDYVSRHNGRVQSLYWFEHNGVYRFSNHWGNVGTNEWELDVPTCKGQWRCGYCKYANFTYNKKK